MLEFAFDENDDFNQVKLAKQESAGSALPARAKPEGLIHFAEKGGQ